MNKCSSYFLFIEKLGIFPFKQSVTDVTDVTDVAEEKGIFHTQFAFEKRQPTNRTHVLKT